MKIIKEPFEEIVKNSRTRKEICIKLNLNIRDKNSYVKISRLFKRFKTNIEHLVIERDNKKYVLIEKECPICESKFKARNNHPKEQRTCSRACSNTFFRSGDNHPNWKENAYRTTCFNVHKKECIICKEYKIVEVHHLDSNKSNNSIFNLIPLCPTHHKYWHSKYRILIEKDVITYIENFKENHINNVLNNNGKNR